MKEQAVSRPALDLRQRLVLGTALATSALLGGYRGYVRRAYADCGPLGGPYLCSGVTTTTQMLTGTPLTVTTDNSFSIDTAAGHALDLSAAGGLIFTDHYRSTITGALDGINAQLFGSGGALSITSTGTVTGTNRFGIYASNLNGSDTRLEVANVSGGVDGIFARHYGSGLLSITATGTVTGTNPFSNGIFAYTGSAAAGLTIEAVDVSGGAYGIQGIHYGIGALSITSTGTVIAGSSYGIYAFNKGTDLTIEAAYVSGGSDGINARQYGSGALSITATGEVTGRGRYGISALNTGTDLTIVAADVDGGSTGIQARQSGSGALSITASGTVKGTLGNGIFATTVAGTTDLTIAAADVTGGSNGIESRHYGSRALSITASGAVEGTNGDGIFALNNHGTRLTIEATDVSGSNDGIYARQLGSGALSITTTGTVAGTSQNGILAYAGVDAIDLTIASADVNGGDGGIVARHYGGGVLSITSTGTVTGAGSYGILAHNAGSDLTIAAADVSGGGDGINARQYGSGAFSIAASGAVTGTGRYGIFALGVGAALTIEAADVGGGSTGISARQYGSGSVSIAASGTVKGTLGNGIFATSVAGTTDLTIAAADVAGGSTGIEAHHYGSGALSITDTGTVTGTNGLGIYARSNNGAGLTIEAADVSGGTQGIYAKHYGSGRLSITTTGTVAGGDTGINALNDCAAAGSTTTVSVGSRGAVEGSTVGVALISTTGRAASLENAGAISGRTGVVARTAGPVTITNSGTITGIGGTAIDLRTSFGPNTFNQQAGTITGDILLSAGPDTVNVTGGAIDGDVTGKGGATLNFALGAGSFTFAAPNAITGMAEINMNSGTVDLQGTATTDRMTVSGGKMIVEGVVNAGTTSIKAGTIAVNGSLTGRITVLGGRLQGTGTVVGDTENFAGGVIAPGNSIGTLTVKGNYTGGGGTLEIEAALGSDASPSDRLVVTGNTSGSTDVRVVNLGGGGAQTVEGIKVIDVGGASNGTFTLIGDHVFQGRPVVIAGAYSYTLQKNGISTPADGDWYLRSALTASDQPVYQPGAPLYEAYAGVLQSFNEPGTLQQRLGNRSWTVEAQGADGLSEEVTTAPGFGVWGTIEGAQGSFDPMTSTTSTDYDVSTWKLETGFDMPLFEQQTGMLVGGVAVHYGRISSDIGSPFGDGSIDSTGYGLAGTLTWYDSTGFYVDGQARVTWFDSDIYSDTLTKTLASGNDGLGYALSLETGQRMPVSERWSLTPQAQLAYAAVDVDDFTDPFGAAVSLEDGDSLLGRLGVSADYEDAWTDAAGQTSRAHIYGIANLYYDFLDGSRVDVSGVDLVSENEALWGGVGLGGSLSFADGKYALYGEALARTSLEDFGDSHVVSGSIGFRVNW
ncbi:autotransporter outer membrane beta-barrel domain-containing protein [Mesorhizobium sp. BAC0120]|uniref:autotransporter outer membrane beta-barrel domain-containing protein n=1 Tax=Mesorhizobium sp. BAC0120 TaxID=3090670 RepID=UPI00298CBA15|nr:autotransporter outer membrane beta-barrel domain-containing protein [Mesorhizobium sp. BAC0120]MDW6021409.1 autotransporter outer membrane beta-barrel domain-containing protein [Mesorhizobium sp. BAC0120]